MNRNTDLARERWAKDLYLSGLQPYVAVWEGADLGGPKGLDDLFLTGGRPRWSELRSARGAPA